VNCKAVSGWRRSQVDSAWKVESKGRIPGHGLGLSIASELAKAHGGELELARSDSEWTEFRLHLPRLGASPAQQPAAIPSKI